MSQSKEAPGFSRGEHVTYAANRKRKRDELYEALGLNRDSPIGEVHKAYRRAAKKAHPDGGGSPEQFALVKLAADTLGDETRRRKYDETGEIDEPEPDTLEANARTMALGAIAGILQEIDRRNADYDEFDLLGDARRSLSERKATNDHQIKNTERKVARLRKAAKKFTAKKGKPNLIGPMMENQASDLERELAKAAATQAVIARALEILNDHGFNWSRSQASAPPAGAMRLGMW